MDKDISFIQQYRYHLIGGGVFLTACIGAGIWHFRRKAKQKKRQTTDYAGVTRTPVRPNTSYRPPSGFCQSSSYPLGYGNCHPDVKVLQRALLALGADLGNYGPNRDGVDGKLGNKTLAALKARTGKTSVTIGDMKRLRGMLKNWGG